MGASSSSNQSPTIKGQKLEGSEILIDTSQNDQKNSQVVFLPDKNLWFVVYEDWSKGNGDIKGRFIKPDGTVCDTIDIQVGPGNQTIPRVAYRDGKFKGDNNSALVITWQDTYNDASVGYIGVRGIDVRNIPNYDSNSTVNCPTNTNYTLTDTFYVNLTDKTNIKALSRQVPKIEYNPSQDKFILGWIELDENENYKGIAFEDYQNNMKTMVRYRGTYLKLFTDIRLNFNDINLGLDYIQTQKPDIVPPFQTSVKKEFQQGNLTDERNYEYLSTINSWDVKCDNTTPICLFVFDATKSTLNVKYTYNSQNGQEGVSSGNSTDERGIYAFFSSDLNFRTNNSRFEYISTMHDKPLLKLNRMSGSKPKNSVIGFGRSQIAGGAFLVVWEDLPYGNDKEKIVGQIVSSGRDVVGENFVISYSDLNGDGKIDDNVLNSKQTNPYVDFDYTNQRFFVIWQDGRNGSSSQENLDIYGQYIDMEGSLRGSNYFINTNPANQYSPVVSYNTISKEFLAVWTDARNYQTTYADIYGQRFSLGMPNLVLLKDENTPLEPALIDFGSINVNSFTTRSFIIKNTGDTSINIDCLEGISLPFKFENLPQEIQICNDGKTLTLVPSTSVTITTSFNPSSEGSFNSSFKIKTDAGEKNVNLQGRAVSPNIKLNIDNNLDFGNIKVGTTKEQIITVTNNGTIDYNITNITGANEVYKIKEDLKYPILVKSGQSVSFTLVFKGNQRGSYTTDITIQTDVNISRTINVTGKVIAPVLKVVETALDFGQTKLNTTSVKTVTIKNEGDDTLNITNVSWIGNQFSVDPYPTTVSAGGTATITVKYTPTQIGQTTGKLTIKTNAGETSIDLSGTGKGGIASITPSQIDFGTIPTNVEKIVSVKLTNTGNDILKVYGITTDKSIFTVRYSGEAPNNTAPIEIAPGGTYTFNISITATTEGAQTGTLTISTDTGTTTTTIYAVVVTPQIKLSATSIDFGDINVNQEKSKQVTITNTSTIDLTITAIDKLDSPFSLTTNLTLPYTLKAGSSLTLTVKFNPTTARVYSSSLNLVFSETSTVTIPLYGKGISNAGPSGSTLGFYDGNTQISTYMFDNILVGKTTSKEICVKTTSGTTIKLVDAKSSSTEFLLNAPVGKDITSDCSKLIITFKPIVQGLRSATITLIDDNNVQYQLSVKGYATVISVNYSGQTYITPTTPPVQGKPENVVPKYAILIPNVDTTQNLVFTVELANPVQNPKYFIVVDNKWKEVIPKSVSGYTLSFELSKDILSGASLSSQAVGKDIIFVVGQDVSSAGNLTPNNPPSSSGGGGGCSMVKTQTNISSAVVNTLIMMSFIGILAIRRLKRS